ncbi:hypothetical protein CsSME_00027269 [Camellia sinensis var. sinensis]
MAKTKGICALLLRALALAATVVAAIVMVTSHEKSTLFTVTFEAKYSHTPAFKYFLVANIIGAVYSFMVLFLPAESMLWRLVVALDVVSVFQFRFSFPINYKKSILVEFLYKIYYYKKSVFCLGLHFFKTKKYKLVW